jgi:hypothetical protein
MLSPINAEGGVTMRKRNRVLTIAVVVLLAAGLAAGFVLAQDSEETSTAAGSDQETMLGRVASILGMEEAALVAAFEQARLEAIDAAVAEGRLTEEQAEAMKAAIETRSAIRTVIENAIESGDLTEDQARLLQQRFQGMRSIGSLGHGFQGRAQGFGDPTEGQGEGARGFGFMLRSPRGMVRGGLWQRCP